MNKENLIELLKWYDDHNGYFNEIGADYERVSFEAYKHLDFLNIPDNSEILVNKHTLDINRCANLIKSMPTDQAIQIMKSDITGQPQTTVIDGELVVAYVR